MAAFLTLFAQMLTVVGTLAGLLGGVFALSSDARRRRRIEALARLCESAPDESRPVLRALHRDQAEQLYAAVVARAGSAFSRLVFGLVLGGDAGVAVSVGYTLAVSPDLNTFWADRGGALIGLLAGMGIVGAVLGYIYVREVRDRDAILLKMRAASTRVSKAAGLKTWHSWVLGAWMAVGVLFGVAGASAAMTAFIIGVRYTSLIFIALGAIALGLFLMVGSYVLMNGTPPVRELDTTEAAAAVPEDPPVNPPGPARTRRRCRRLACRNEVEEPRGSGTASRG